MFLTLPEYLLYCSIPPCKPVSWAYRQHLSSTVTLVGHSADSLPTFCDRGSQIPTVSQGQFQISRERICLPHLRSGDHSGVNELCWEIVGSPGAVILWSPPFLQELEVPKGTHIPIGGGVRGTAASGLSGLLLLDLPSALTNPFHLEQIMDLPAEAVMLNQHGNEFVRDQMCRVGCGHKVHQGVWSAF